MHRFTTPLLPQEEESEQTEESHEQLEKYSLLEHGSRFNEGNWRTHWRTVYSMPNSDISTLNRYKQIESNNTNSSNRRIRSNWRTTSTRSVPVINSTYVQQTSSAKLNSLNPLTPFSFQIESPSSSSSSLLLSSSEQSSLPHKTHGANKKSGNTQSYNNGNSYEISKTNKDAQSTSKWREPSWSYESEKEEHLVKDDCKAIQHVSYSTPVLHSYNKFSSGAEQEINNKDDHYIQHKQWAHDPDNNNSRNNNSVITSKHNWRNRFANNITQQEQENGNAEKGVTSSSLSLMPVMNIENNTITSDKDSRERRSYNNHSFRRTQQNNNRPHSFNSNNNVATTNPPKNRVLSSSSISFSSSSLLLLPEQSLESSTHSSHSKVVPTLHFQHKNQKKFNKNTIKEAQPFSRARSLFASTPLKEESYEVETKEHHLEQDELKNKINNSAHNTMTNLCSVSSPSPEPYVAYTQNQYDELKKQKEKETWEQQQLTETLEHEHLDEEQIANIDNVVVHDVFKKIECTTPFTKRNKNFNEYALVVLENVDETNSHLELEELIISRLRECSHNNANSNQDSNTMENKLCKLDLSNVNFGGDNEEQPEWTWFCTFALPRLFFVKELRLVNCNLSDAQLHLFAESLQTTRATVQLDRKDKELHDHSYETMNDIKNEQKEHSPYNSKMPYLELLDLSCNANLTQNCVVSMSKIIASCAHSLRYLYLRRINLTDDGLHMLSSAIVALNQHIKEVNYFPHEEKRDVIERENYYKAHSHFALESLDICQCNMSIHGLSQTLATLSQVESLTKLSISHDINKVKEYNKKPKVLIKDASTTHTIMSTDEHNRYNNNSESSLPHLLFTRFAAMHCPCNLKVVKLTHFALSQTCTLLGCRELLLNLLFCCPNMEVLHLDHCFSNAHLPQDVVHEEWRIQHEGNISVQHCKQNHENEIEEEPIAEKKKQFFLPHASIAHQVRVGDVLCELFAHAAFSAASRHQPLPRFFTHVQELSINESGLSDYGVQALVVALSTYNNEHNIHDYETKNTESENDKLEDTMLSFLRVLRANANPLLSVNGCTQLIHYLIVRNDETEESDYEEVQNQQENFKNHKSNCQLELLDIRHCGELYQWKNDNDNKHFKEKADKEDALQRLMCKVESALARRLQDELHRLQSEEHRSQDANGKQNNSRHTRCIAPLTILFAESSTSLPEWLVSYIHNTGHETGKISKHKNEKQRTDEANELEEIADGLFVHCDSNGLIELNYNEKALLTNMYKVKTLSSTQKSNDNIQRECSNYGKNRNGLEENTHRQKSVEQLSAEVTEELYWHKLQSCSQTTKSVSYREHNEGNRAHTSSQSAQITSNNIRENEKFISSKEIDGQHLMETPERYVNSNMCLPEVISVTGPLQTVNAKEDDNVKKIKLATQQKANNNNLKDVINYNNDTHIDKKNTNNCIANAACTHYTSLDSDNKYDTCIHYEQPSMNSNDTVLNVNEALVMPVITHINEYKDLQNVHHTHMYEHNNNNYINRNAFGNGVHVDDDDEVDGSEEELYVISQPPMPESSESCTIAEIRNGTIHLVQSSWDESSPSVNTISVIPTTTSVTTTNVTKAQCPLPVTTKHNKSTSDIDAQCTFANRTKMNNATQSLSSQLVESQQKEQEEEDKVALVRSKLELSSPIAAVPLSTELSEKQEQKEKEKSIERTNKTVEPKTKSNTNKNVGDSNVQENTIISTFNVYNDNDDVKDENSADRWVTINNSRSNNLMKEEVFSKPQLNTQEVKLDNKEVKVESKATNLTTERMESEKKERVSENKAHKDEFIVDRTEDDDDAGVVTPKSHKRSMRKPHSFSVYYQHPVGHVLCRTMHLLTSHKHGKAACHALQLDLQHLLQPSQSASKSKTIGNNNTTPSEDVPKPKKTEMFAKESENTQGQSSVEWNTLDESRSKFCNDSDMFYEAREAESETNNDENGKGNAGTVSDGDKNTTHDRSATSSFIIQVHSVQVITTPIQDKLHSVKLQHQVSKTVEDITWNSQQNLPQRYKEAFHSLFDKDEAGKHKNSKDSASKDNAYINTRGANNEEMEEQITPLIRVKVTSNFSRIQLHDRLHRKLNVASLFEQRKILPHFMQIISPIANYDAVKLVEEIALESPYAELILREEFDHSAAMAVHATHYANGFNELLNRLLCEPTENSYESEKDAESVDVNEEVQENVKHDINLDELNPYLLEEQQEDDNENEEEEEEEHESSPPKFDATKRPGMFDTESLKLSSSSESAGLHDPESLHEFTSAISTKAIEKKNKNIETVSSELKKEEQIPKSGQSQHVVEVVAEPLALDHSNDNKNNVNNVHDKNGDNDNNVIVEDVIHVAPLAVKENVNNDNTPIIQEESTKTAAETKKTPKREKSDITINTSDNEVEIITSPLDVMKSVNLPLHKNVVKKNDVGEEEDDDNKLQVTTNKATENEKKKQPHVNKGNTTKNTKQVSYEQEEHLQENQKELEKLNNSHNLEMEKEKHEVKDVNNAMPTFADPIRVERPLHNLSGALKTFVLPYSHLEGNAVCRAWNVLHRDDALSAHARQALEDDFLSLLQPNDKDLLHVVLSVHLHGVSACNSLDNDGLFINHSINATTAANGIGSSDQVNNDDGATPINLPFSELTLEQNSPCTFLQLRVHTNERRVTLVRRLQRHTQELDDKYYLTSSNNHAPKPCPFPRLTYFLFCHPEEDTLCVLERYLKASPGKQIMKTHLIHQYRSLAVFIHYTHFNPSLLLRELHLESMQDLYTLDSKNNSETQNDSWLNSKNGSITTKKNETEKEVLEYEDTNGRADVLHGEMRKSSRCLPNEEPEMEWEHKIDKEEQQDEQLQEQEVEFVQKPLLHETDGHESDSALGVIVSPSTAASTPQASVTVSHSRLSLRRQRSSGSGDNTELNSGPHAMVMISPMSIEPNSPVSFSLTNVHHTNTFATDDDNDDVDDENENEDGDVVSHVKNRNVVLESDTNRKATTNETLTLPTTDKKVTLEEQQETNTINAVNINNNKPKQATYDVNEKNEQEPEIVVPLPSFTSLLSSHRNSTEQVYEDVKEPLQPTPHVKQKAHKLSQQPTLSDFSEQLVQSELTPEHFRSESLTTTTFSAGANDGDSATQLPQAHAQHASLENEKQHHRHSHNRKYSLDDSYNKNNENATTSHRRSKHRHRYNNNRSSAEASGKRNKRSHHNSSNHPKEREKNVEDNKEEEEDEDEDGYSISTSRSNSSQRRSYGERGGGRVHNYHHARRVLSRRKTQTGSMSNSNDRFSHNQNNEDDMTGSQLEHLSSESFSEHRFRAEWKRRLEHKHRRLLRIAYDAMSKGNIALDPKHRDVHAVGKGKWLGQSVTLTLEWEILFVLTFTKSRPFASTRKAQMLVHPVAFGFSAEQEDPDRKSAGRKRLILNIERAYRPSTVGIDYGAIEERLMQGALYTASGSSGNKDSISNRSKTARQLLATPTNLTSNNNSTSFINNDNNANNHNNALLISRSTDLSSEMSASSTINNAAMHFVARLIDDRIRLVIEMKTSKEVVRAANMLENTVRRAQQAIERSMLANKDHNVSNETS